MGIIESRVEKFCKENNCEALKDKLMELVNHIDIEIEHFTKCNKDINYFILNETYKSLGLENNQKERTLKKLSIINRFNDLQNNDNYKNMKRAILEVEERW